VTAKKTKHVPTEITRAQVALLAAIQTKQDVIAKTVGLSDIKTLGKYYRHELDNGLDLMVATLGGKLYKMATTDTHSSQFQAIIALLKLRAGWRESIALTNQDGSDILKYVENASDEQLKALEKIYADIAKAAGVVTRERGTGGHSGGTRKAANAA
jgi:hypothetical protein